MYRLAGVTPVLRNKLEDIRVRNDDKNIVSLTLLPVIMISYLWCKIEACKTLMHTSEIACRVS